MTKRVVLAMTGASGACYGIQALRAVEPLVDTVYFIVSHHGRQVLETEAGVPREVEGADFVRCLLGRPSARVSLLSPDDYFTPPASGSARHDGMLIAPCSMGTAGRIASGVSTDLITRAADVCLKEKRPLVLMVRETPLSVVHLRNLTTLAEAGAIVLPACPSFYDSPQTIQDLVEGLVRRALRHLGMEIAGGREWRVR